MLAHRLRLWANIKSTLAQRLVFAGTYYIISSSTETQERFNKLRCPYLALDLSTSPTSTQHIPANTKHRTNAGLKRHNQAKIRLKSFIFCAADLPVERDIETRFPYFLFRTFMSKIRNTGILYISLNLKIRSKKKKIYSSCLWTCLHHIVILSLNKITDFLTFLA